MAHPGALWRGERGRGSAGRFACALLVPLICLGAAAASCADPPADCSPTAGASARDRMVQRQIVQRGIRDPAVLAALRSVPRHCFVPAAIRDRAYADTPLPIGRGQTISQPYIVALMTELLEPRPADRVLEIGTGSGYQAAVLARIVAEVFSVEIVPALARESAARIRELGIGNVHIRAGDGRRGWPEKAPFDGILVTAAAEEIPAPLIRQLKPGGRLIMPVGGEHAVQRLTVVSKDGSGEVTRREVLPVRFVPLVEAP